MHPTSPLRRCSTSWLQHRLRQLDANPYRTDLDQLMLEAVTAILYERGAL